MGFDALSDRSKSVERARRRKSHGTEFPQEARMGSHKGKTGRTCGRKPLTQTTPDSLHHSDVRALRVYSADVADGCDMCPRSVCMRAASRPQQRVHR